MQTERKTVFVGLSGGVDSSVAALKLKQEGYSVVGVFIKVWHPDFLDCNWEGERLDAMRVAAALDIPFLTCDAEQAYKREVADHFIESYAAGRTPNPDVLCNQAVKFGAFLQFARQHGADHIATGHYVRREAEKGAYALKRGRDDNKDQSYFLWTLSQTQLQRALFPVGGLEKDETRSIAAQNGIPVAAKKDSQGICFLGAIDIPDFLSHYIDLSPGDVLSREGKVIGRHKGAFVYTLGQRHGFTIENEGTMQKPHYVIAKDIENNTITVDTQPPVNDQSDIWMLEAVNWIREVPQDGALVNAQVRYRQPVFPVRVYIAKDGAVTITPERTVDTPASGQSCVLYKGEECLGGGIIAGRSKNA